MAELLQATQSVICRVGMVAPALLTSEDTQGAVTENSAWKGFVSQKEVQLLFSIGIILSNTWQCLLCLKLTLDFLWKVSDGLKWVPDQALGSRKGKQSTGVRGHPFVVPCIQVTH